MTLADGLATFSVNRCHNPIENQPMAKVLTTEARVANFVIDDLRRRPIDGLLKQVGLRRADRANPEYRLPHVLVLRLIERAASLVGDASYGLRLGASRDTPDRGLLGFLLLNSLTLMDGMTNLQRYSRVVGEGENLEIERNGAHVVLRFREADPALRGLRHNSDFVAASVVRGCRDLTRQAISPIRAELIGEEPNAKVEYADILGCPIKVGAEWDALVYSEETTTSAG